MMTVEQALLRLIDIKMKITVHCENIKEDAKHLPDDDAIDRISNEIEAVKRCKKMIDAYIADAYIAIIDDNLEQ